MTLHVASFHLDGGYSRLTYLRLRILAFEKEDDS
jgi:hypothetical protein